MSSREDKGGGRRGGEGWIEGKRGGADTVIRVRAWARGREGGSQGGGIYIVAGALGLGREGCLYRAETYRFRERARGHDHEVTLHFLRSAIQLPLCTVCCFCSPRLG